MTQEPNMTSDEVGHAIQRAREAKGWTLRQLAEEADIDFGYIGRLERGEIRRPGAGRLQRLASALDVDIEDFYGLAGYLAPKGLPGLPAYLRAKYDIPAEASERVERYLARLKKELERDAEGEGRS
jgi:transcriptional regulator with XRE-family HTH domain